MKANESILISNSEKRQLTAKGYKFVEKVRGVACKQRNLHRFSKDMKSINSKIGDLVVSLIIDKRMTEKEIITFISASLNTGGLLN